MICDSFNTKKSINYKYSFYVWKLPGSLLIQCCNLDLENVVYSNGTKHFQWTRKFRCNFSEISEIVTWITQSVLHVCVECVCRKKGKVEDPPLPPNLQQIFIDQKCPPPNLMGNFIFEQIWLDQNCPCIYPFIQSPPQNHVRNLRF